MAGPGETIELLDDLLKELDEEEARQSSTPAEPAPASEPAPELEEREAPAPSRKERAKRATKAGSERAEAADEVAGAPVDAVSAAPSELGARDTSLELARAEAEALKRGLARQQAIELELRKELADLRGQLGEMNGRIEQLNGRFVPAAPVAFLSADGRSVARKAFYALGKGEALDTYLTALLSTWSGTGRELIAHWDEGGLSLHLEGDPDRRSIRHLTSGVYLIQLSPSELEGLGQLPPLVRLRQKDARTSSAR